MNQQYDGIFLDQKYIYSISAPYQYQTNPTWRFVRHILPDAFCA